MIDFALPVAVRRAVRIRDRLRFAESELRSGRLPSAAASLSESLREIDELIALARRAGVRV